nr:hypothetical protein CPAG_01987 [Coccidioides posadasii RMSCC 3488]
MTALSFFDDFASWDPNRKNSIKGAINSQSTLLRTFFFHSELHLRHCNQHPRHCPQYKHLRLLVQHSVCLFCGKVALCVIAIGEWFLESLIGAKPESFSSSMGSIARMTMEFH